VGCRRDVFRVGTEGGEEVCWAVEDVGGGGVGEVCPGTEEA
jgi:hypothetical protein